MEHQSTDSTPTQDRPVAHPNPERGDDSPGLALPVRPFPPNRKPLALIGTAFLVGVLGTAGVMSRFVASSRPVPTQVVTHQASDEGKAPEKSATDAEGMLIKFSPAAAKTAGVRVETARRSLSGDTLTVPGTVETSPNRGAKITPPVSGKVIRILVNLGDSVRAGQPLAVLDSPDVAQAHAAIRQAESTVVQAFAGLNTARSQIDQARAKERSAKTTLDRQRQLAQAGAFSQGPLAAAQSELSAAQTEQAQAQTERQTRASSQARAERLFQNQLVSQAELEQTQADFHQSEARAAQAATRVNLAKQALARERKVFGGNLLNKQAIQTAEADVFSAQADVRTAEREAQVARAALQGARTGVVTARANLSTLEGGRHTEGGAGWLTLAAPLGGVVTDRQATLGEAVERSTTLFQIQNLGAVLVSANVPEAQISRVRSGQRAEVVAASYPSRVFPGVVQSLGSQVDEKTRTLPVRVLVENRQRLLKPDMFARVSLAVGGQAGGLTVPASAVDEDGTERFVYVERADGYEKRPVQIGRVGETCVQVVSGLQPGERVATDGMFVLKSESKKGELKGDED